MTIGHGQYNFHGFNRRVHGNRLTTILQVGFLTVFWSGCAPLSPLVKLDPAPPVSVPAFLNRPSLYLTVIDERASASLGALPARAPEKPKSAKAVVPLEEVVRIHVTAALTRAGFSILSTPTQTSPQLVVQIKRLDFSLTKGATWAEIAGKGTLTVSANAGSSSRTKTYDAENGQKWAFSAPADGHERYLNLLLGDLLNAFLTDEKFLSFLASAT